MYIFTLHKIKIPVLYKARFDDHVTIAREDFRP